MTPTTVEEALAQALRVKQEGALHHTELHLVVLAEEVARLREDAARLAVLLTSCDFCWTQERANIASALLTDRCAK